MKKTSITIVLLLVGSMVCLSVMAQPVIQLVEIAAGFTKPVDITHAGDERLFIVEQRGLISVLDANRNVATTAFLDIRNKVSDNANEKGLLGLAFHPRYQDNGFFYVNYTNGSNTIIARYTVSANDASVADAGSESILLTVEQPFGNHNGGCLKFGSDGYLYIGLGDGGSGGDPRNFSQNNESLLGKMLRIDVDNGMPYAIPPDNPFINDATVRDEIWATGLRNPWRFSFDRTTNDMWIGDVGQDAWEEVSFQSADSKGGENYGWRCFEGFEDFRPSGCSIAETAIPPIHVYQTGGPDGNSITGGFVYRGKQQPSLSGHYIFGDYVSTKMWSLTPNTDGNWNRVELLNSGIRISGFGEDLNGELYVAAHFQGKIYQIMDDQTSPVDELSTISNIEIQPNPFQEHLDLGLEVSSASPIQLQIVTTNGQVVFQKTLKGLGLLKERISLNGIPNGLYYLELEQEGKRLIRKIVKQ